MIYMGIGGFVMTIIGMGIYFYFNGHNNKAYKYDLEVLEERVNNVPVSVKDIARVFVDDDTIKKIHFKKYDFTWEPPMLDSIIMQDNGRPKIVVWRDINGNFHNVRRSKWIPVVRKENGKIVEYKDKEIIFTPDNRSSENWAKLALKQMHDRHIKAYSWWSENKGLVIVGIVSMACVMSIFIVGYWHTSFYKDVVSACSGAVNEAKGTLSGIKSVVGLS